MLIKLLESQYNLIGIIGVITMLVAYLLLQVDKLRQDSMTYSVLNLVGAALILVSLYYAWNLAAGVIEIAWLVISLFGVIKAYYLKRRNKKSKKTV